MNAYKFTERMERGQYPVNISTSLALESLMGIHPEVKHPSPPYLNYDQYWMNARTLYRNITGSFPADMQLQLVPGIIAELMHDEWEMIKDVLTNSSRLVPVLYLCNYKKVETRFKRHTIFKGDTTVKQVEERKRMEKAIQIFMDDVGEGYMQLFDTDIKPESSAGRFIIQTHIAVDLLSKRHFDDLDLLESHTGAIKNQSLWYTKYLNGKDLSMIPFTQYFLRIFGDREFFSPKDSALRKAIVELGQKYKWNPLTTDARVRQGLDQLSNPFFREVVKDMM